MGRKDSRSRSRDRIEDDRSQSQVQEDNSDIERESKVNSKKRSEKEKEKESRNNHASKSPKKTKKENGGAVRESNKDTNKRESNRTSDKTDTAKHSSIKSERADRGSAGHIQSSTNLCIESCVTDTTDRDGNYSFAIKLTKEDAGFLQGKKGRTKMKLENVSGVKLVIGENNEGRYLQISGKNVDRDLVVKAEKYVKCLIQQRKGVDDFELMADLLSPIHNDLTQLKVPQQAVAFVTGKAGCFLRQIEEDWGVLMFFSEFEKGRSNNLKAKTEEDAAKERPFENLAIFGDKRSRRGAELKILSAVESKCPGYFKDHEVEILDRDNDLNDSSILGPHKMDHDAIGRDLQDADWKTDVLKFKQDELSFALGKKGATRKKLEDSSGCIVQYVGQFALFSGTSPQRRRIKEYLRWLFEQLDSPVTIPNPQDRDDLTLVDVPQSTVGYITGQNRQALSQIGAENGVLMFFVGKCKKDQEGRELLTEAEKRKKDELDPDATERLAIFGPERGRLGAMLRVWWSVDLKCPGKFSDLIPGENKSEWGRDRIGLDYMKICEEDIGYTLGKKGTTKIKIVNASNCELQFLGLYACMVGTLEERQNCKDYINWLLAQRKGKMTIDIKNRTDVIAMDITKSFGSWCTNPMNAEEMRAIEVETKTFIFLAHTVDEPEAGERLMIFSTKDGHESLGYGRPAAEMRLRYLMNDMESNRPRGGGGFGNNNRFGGGNSNNNGYGAHGGNMNYNNRMMMNGHGGGGGYGNGGGGGFNNRGGGRGRGGGDSRSPRRGGGGRRRNDSRGERGGDRDRRGRGGGGRRRDSRRRDSRRRRSRSRNRR